MKKSIHPVTDRVVVRYLEHVTGLDIEAIRATIGRKVETGLEHGAGGVRVDGLHFVLAGGTVTDLFPACKPPKHIGSCKRRREFD